MALAFWRGEAGLQLITRNANDFSSRFPLIAMAVSKLPVRSCLIDGEAIVCDENGLAVFELIRRQWRTRHYRSLCFQSTGARRQGSAAASNRKAQRPTGRTSQWVEFEHRPQ
jgi:hypothetical protein